MGASESIFNDSAEPVMVWWQDYGGSETTGPVLNPGATSPPQRFSLSLVHEMCVKYRVPSDPQVSRITCKENWSPSERGQDVTYQVSDIVGQGVLPAFKGSTSVTIGAPEQQTPAQAPSTPVEPVSSHPVSQPQPSYDKTHHVEYFFVVLFASFNFALIGIKCVRRFCSKTPVGAREPLMNAGLGL